MNCMNCGSTEDVIDFNKGEEKIILCAGCRYRMASGQKVMPNKQVGRPPLGVTKKVSLTLPAAVWEHMDKEAKGNRSEYLRKLLAKDMWSRGDWSNNACLGYAIIGAKNLGYSDEQLFTLVQSMDREFDCKTIDEAKAIYERSPY